MKMVGLNKYIKQYLDHTYPICEDGYIHTDNGLFDISNDITLCYGISHDEANQYVLEYYNYKFNLKNSDGYWYECTYDSNGNELIFKDSNGYWNERTYDDNGNQLTWKDSTGFCTESTYDQNGKQLTCKNGQTK